MTWPVVEPSSPEPSAPVRKHWSRSYKVRCAWIATLFPLGSLVMWRVTGTAAPEWLIAMCMSPWLALGGGETVHDGIKLWKGE